VLVVLCAALAVLETISAKMRVLLAPRLLAVGAPRRSSESSVGWSKSREKAE
jgi:hypothetical protein